eukprot:gene9576-19901_t
MTDMHTYISSVNTCIARENGKVLANLIAIPVGKMQITKEMRILVERARVVSPLTYCVSNVNDQGIAMVVGQRLLALVAIVGGDWATAYQSELAAYNSILDYFKEDSSYWVIPALTKIMNDLRLLASQADSALKQRDNEFLKDAQMKLTNSFTMVAKDRTPVSSPNSKRLAIFAVTNVLFKIYFKLNTLQLCGKLINVVERTGFIESLEYFPVSDVVTYKYYIGRLKMLEDRFEEARESLSFALQYTPLSEIRNRQRILISLAPVQMCLGIMPSRMFETKYKLAVLSNLGEAVVRGDLKSFENIMKTNQRSFIRMGIFLVLEQVKVLVYRNLFKRVFLIKNTAHLWLGIFE